VGAVGALVVPVGAYVPELGLGAAVVGAVGAAVVGAVGAYVPELGLGAAVVGAVGALVPHSYAEVISRPSTPANLVVVS